MLARVLVVACVCATALTLTPLSAAGEDNDCALYLAGPGRTSSYDYNLNLLRGNFAYEGQHTCITYDAVNQAYLEARKRIVVAQPKGDWKPEDYASVGELILDISINLAKTYGLTYEEIEKGLPLIDTSRTLIREVCPPIFSHVECRAGKYRRMDGLCNNLEHPTWGATNAPFQRLIGPLFADGINAPRISHTGRDLPLSRIVSRTMHPDDGFHDHAGTIMVIAWGQFMDHDYTLTGTPLDPINRNDPEECCKRPLHLKHPYCNEIRIPDDDYFYRLWGVKCIDFVRAFPSPRPGCRLGSRAPYNTLTGSIDGNTVYGVTEKFARKLRTGYGGLLRMNPVFKDYGLKDLLPLKLDIPDEGCTRPNKNMYCFEAGEIRVNEQLILTVMHTLSAREHNRVAHGLAAVNPHWDDETLYQEARRINIAEIQHITYNEFLPILLGKDVMDKFGLVLQKDGYWDGYDQTVNPDVIASFAAAAYRFGHSLLPTAVERWSKAHKFIASKRLSDLIRRPYDLYRAGVLDEYVMGLMNQVAQAMDDSITQEVTNHLFKKVGSRFGMDLVSFNMQRGREFGVPGYMEFRKFCGLSGAESFEGLFGSMPNETVRKYETIFEHPIDVDLWSGGVSERPLPGSMLGPTFACIIATQFSYSRRGDRFWYELPNQPSSFTPEQLTELRKARLARIICDNTDIIDTVQLYPMVLPDHELNPRVPCRSGIIPSMDFSKWAEPPPSFPSAAKQFITDAIATGHNSSDECIDTTENGINKSRIQEKSSTLDIECDNSTASNSNEKAQQIITLAADNCTENVTGDKPIINSETVMKYVYKKNEKEDIHRKPEGHIKNSLKRKRRFIVREEADTSSHDTRKNIPLIVDYDTLHRPDKENTIISPVLRLQEEILPPIKDSDLANFNIETLHEPSITDSEERGYNENRKSNYNKAPKPFTHQLSSDNHRHLQNSERSQEVHDTRDNISTNQDSIENDKFSLINNKNSKEDIKIDDKENHYKTIPSKSVEDDNEENYHTRENSPKKTSQTHDSKEDYYKAIPSKSVEDDNEENYNTRENSPKKTSQTHDSKEDYYKTIPSKSVEDDNEENYHSKENSPKKTSQNHDSKEDYRKYDDAKSQSVENYNSKERSQSSEETHPPSSSENEHSKENYKNNERSREQTNDNLENSRSNESIQDSDERVNKLSNNKNDNYHNDGKFQKSQEINDDEKNQHSRDSTEVSGNKGKISNYLQKNLSDKNVKHENIEDSPNHIRDVDLDDFSYERIQIKDGQVEAVPDISNESNENVDIKNNNSNSNVISNSKSNDDKPFIEYPADVVLAPLLKEIEHDNDNGTPINDGEIKPVVEITDDENEPSEEISDNFDGKDELQNILSGSLIIPSDKETPKSDQELINKNERVNVKQQFERIPLDYNHDKGKPEKKNEDDVNNDNDGTIDAVPTKEVIYDDNLDFKFGDVSIKLPEIKLPDDILSYNYDEKSNEDEREHRNEYRPYNQNLNKKENKENTEDDIESGENSNNNDDDYYYGRYSNEKPKNKKKEKEDNESTENDSDEEEDLYEKFVRERFGKRGSFKNRASSERRSGSLKLAPVNSNLYGALKQILNKTKRTSKEAENSGDPNAGYMWTLEYGQQL